MVAVEALSKLKQNAGLKQGIAETAIGNVYEAIDRFTESQEAKLAALSNLDNLADEAKIACKKVPADNMALISMCKQSKAQFCLFRAEVALQQLERAEFLEAEAQSNFENAVYHWRSKAEDALIECENFGDDALCVDLYHRFELINQSLYFDHSNSMLSVRRDPHLNAHGTRGDDGGHEKNAKSLAEDLENAHIEALMEDVLNYMLERKMFIDKLKWASAQVAQWMNEATVDVRVAEQQVRHYNGIISGCLSQITAYNARLM
jgi:hypothetical protein